MMVNGVFFTDLERIDAFVQDQKRRQHLRIAVYEKQTESGAWIIICALDPNRVYSNAERAAIREVLDRQQRTLRTRRLFDRLWDDPP